VPAKGAVGVDGCTATTTLFDAVEVHPAELVTVKVNVPDGTPVTVVTVPDPGVVIPPGVLVSVHAPVEGNPFKITLPVATEQVG